MRHIDDFDIHGGSTEEDPYSRPAERKVVDVGLTIIVAAIVIGFLIYLF